jgi:hypothetical protein
MKHGTMLDFLQLVEEDASLQKELVELAHKYGFEFESEDLTDDQLDAVSGGGRRCPVGEHRPPKRTSETTANAQHAEHHLEDVARDQDGDHQEDRRLRSAQNPAIFFKNRVRGYLYI